MRRFVFSMFILVMILGVFGGAMLAQDGGQAGWVDATFADITGRAPNYYSQTVRVRGVIADFISTNVFVLRDPTSMEAPGIIVINNSGQQVPNVYVQGQEVLVTGRIHPSFDALAADPTLRIASHFENAGGVAGGGQTAATVAEGQGGQAQGQGGQTAGGQAQGGAETGSQQNVAPAEGNTLQATPTSEEPQLNTTGGEDANVASGDAGAGNVNAPMLTTPSSAQDAGAGSDTTAATSVGATPGTEVAAVATGTVMATGTMQAGAEGAQATAAPAQGTAAPAAGTAQPGAEGAQPTVDPSQPTAQSGQAQPSEIPPDALAATTTAGADALAATTTAGAGALPTPQMPEATQTAASVISQTNQVSAGMPYLWEDTLALVYGDFLPADIRSFAILEITAIDMLMYPSDVAPEANTSG